MVSAAQALSLQQKQAIVQEYNRRRARNIKCTQKAIGEWAQEKLRLSTVPNQSTVSRILKHAAEFKDLPAHQSAAFKKRRAPAAPKLEDALYKWICKHANEGKQINGPVTIAYARRLQTEANKHLPANKQLDLRFSEGWIERFKKRYGLCYRRVHGEALSADNAAITEHWPRLCRLMMTYEARDVWNADEFGLFFRQPLGWTLSPKEKKPSGHKKDKTRITFLPCCNSDGSEKMPLMIIGRSEKPRAFGKSSGCELGFDYHWNKKAWMNQHLFFSWLERFDRYISREKGRKVLLLIDNCSAHGNERTLPSLENVRVDFLPPNTTSKIQPLDAGIIAWVKTKFRRRLLLRIFENIDMGKNQFTTSIY